MADIFISYKREDKHLAEDTIHQLQDAGFSVWYDERITPHTSWDETIEAEIAAAKAVVVLWTPRSVLSEWVRTEADYAKEKGKLVPVILEACSIPLAYRRTQTVDLSAWDGNPADRSFQKLVGWVRGLVAGTGSAPGSIGPSTSAPGSSRPGRKSRTGLYAVLAILLVGGGGGLYATGLLDKPLALLTAETDTSEIDTPAPEPTPPPEPQAPACIRLSITADEKGPHGNWDFPAPRPDITVTSDSHGNVRFSCDNDYRCSSGNFQNTGRQDRITLLVQDEDIDEADLMGAGNCAIPSSSCRIGRVTVRISGC
ncbi:MAG: toll/interleukin-1 receptor domain-containing protein [Hyphomonadaceae bacterium]|nr:toll/interleukin-1 receptor domain-containing protein [Hyphomonadaceae bacterium]